MKDVAFLWIAYAVLLAALFVLFSGHVHRLTQPEEKTFITSLTTILLLIVACAAFFLPALDIALVASTNIPILGVRKDAATDSKVDTIVLWIKVAYIAVYGAAAFLSFVAVPWSWFYYEEWDDDSTTSSRIGSASKYTILLLLTFGIVFALGLIMPSANLKDGIDLGHWKDLITSSRPLRSLLFMLGLLLIISTLTMLYYGASGLAILPISLLKTTTIQDAEVELDLNRQKQRQIELQYEGTRSGIPANDRKKLDALQAQEMSLIRAQREGTWKFTRTIYVALGVVSLALSIFVLEMILTSLVRELISTSACGPRCAFLGSSAWLPLDWIFSDAPYFASFVLHVLFGLFLVISTIRGFQALGIRFLWTSLFPINGNGTTPQGLLTYGLLMILAVVGLQYTTTTFILPSYSVYGGQTYCNGTLAQCADDKSYVLPCSNDGIDCVQSVISRILDSMTANFPLFSTILFWAQFAIPLIWIVSVLTTMLRKRPALDETTTLL